MADGIIKANKPGMTVTPVPFVAGAAPAAAAAPGGTSKPAVEGGAKPSPTPAAPAAKQ